MISQHKGREGEEGPSNAEEPSHNHGDNEDEKEIEQRPFFEPGACDDIWARHGEKAPPRG